MESNTFTHILRKRFNLRQGTELITFICPADWMMFQVPNSLDFTSIENSRGEEIKSTIEKLETMEEFRKGEFLELLNKQYSNASLENPKKVKVNPIVLVRNIANEPKREPLKLARIVKIHDSRDVTQRVVTLTYHNVKQNKNGEWIGKPVRVDRSINDLVLVDNASNESMLNPSIIEGNEKDEEIHQEKDINNDVENDGNDENNDSEIELHDDSREDGKLMMIKQMMMKQMNQRMTQRIKMMNQRMKMMNRRRMS